MPPVGLVVDALVRGGIVPGLVALAVLAAARRWRPASHERWETWAGTAAYVLGIAAGCWALAWVPMIPTHDWEWAPLASAGMACVGAIAVQLGLSRPARALLLYPAAFLAAFLLVPDWPSLAPLRWAYVAAMGVLIVLVGRVFDEWARRIPGPSAILCCLASLLTAAVVLGQSGSAKFAQLVGLGLAVAAAFALANWRRIKATPITGLAFGSAVLLGGLLIDGKLYSYSDVPSSAYGLAAIAPAAGWIAGAVIRGKRAATWSFWIRIAGVVIPLLVALTFAFLG